MHAGTWKTKSAFAITKVMVLLQSKNWNYVAEWLSKLTLRIASDVGNCTIFFPPFLCHRSLWMMVLLQVKIEIMSQNGWVNWHYLSSHTAVNCTIFSLFSPKFDQKIEIRHERRNPSSDVSIDIARIKPQFSNLICQKQQIQFPKDSVLAFTMSNSGT